ncbi:hypothetical protein TrVGV298_011476 [Trichoderma virens]|nr:hypothetical protein TrVGV298_011476 [Trichoderma virens]
MALGYGPQSDRQLCRTRTKNEEAFDPGTGTSQALCSGVLGAKLGCRRAAEVEMASPAATRGRLAACKAKRWKQRAFNDTRQCPALVPRPNKSWLVLSGSVAYGPPPSSGTLPDGFGRSSSWSSVRSRYEEEMEVDGGRRVQQGSGKVGQCGSQLSQYLAASAERAQPANSRRRTRNSEPSPSSSASTAHPPKAQIVRHDDDESQAFASACAPASPGVSQTRLVQNKPPLSRRSGSASPDLSAGQPTRRIHKPPFAQRNPKPASCLGRLRQHAHSSAPLDASLAPVQCLDCSVPSLQSALPHHQLQPLARSAFLPRVAFVASHCWLWRSRTAAAAGMSMFRFWSCDPRGSDKTVNGSPAIAFSRPPNRTSSVACDPASQAVPLDLSPRKRSHRDVDNDDEDDDAMGSVVPAKRPRAGSEALAEEPSFPKPRGPTSSMAAESSAVDSARDLIQAEFCQEILLKHKELRLINQELAKCQIALEQLRRCHLIPYPVNCPTPQQMLDVSDGKGPAVVAKAGDAVPRWAPPFGVVDGPYSRHYAKWLIPDPAFDGIQPEMSHLPARGPVLEGRTTRNSNGEVGYGFVKGRRGNGSHKFESLSSGYPPPKDKVGPCVLTRADGQTVKLVCLDCHRDNFSSTQGFINHCRIAHKRDFKSHEEAAVHCGQPYEPSEGDMVEQDIFKSLRMRISDSLKLYNQGKLSVVKFPRNINAVAYPGKASASSSASSFGPSSEAPHLSRLLKARNFQGNLHDVVADAKSKVLLEDLAGEESEADGSVSPMQDSPPTRASVVMRMPARTAKTPVSVGTSARPTSSKGRAAHMALASPSDSDMAMMANKHRSDAVLSDEDVDMEDADMSPNTLVSNNAPSLVSDDGEYDDSDEGSSVSGASDQLEAESVSDVAEISLDFESDSRGLRRESAAMAGPVRLRKEEAKQVTFIGPVRSSAKERRQRKA